jgi:hypothetical protein
VLKHAEIRHVKLLISVLSFLEMQMNLDSRDKY